MKSKESDRAKYFEFPDGGIYSAHSRAAEEAFSEIAPVFEFWEDMDAEELPVKIGTELKEKVRQSKEVLKKNNVCRSMRFLDVRLHPQNNGSTYRKWNHTDREWQACELECELLISYKDGSGELLAQPIYISTAIITYSMSRRLREEEKKKVKVKDKWGHRITDKTDFYTEMGLANCPSCGAELPKDIKDAVCPYCGSTIFADFYDWQVESIEIEPETFGSFFSSLFKKEQTAKQVTSKKKKLDQKIVRFSENDFRKDVLESCMDEVDRDQLIDLFLGELEIKSIRNTDDDTILGIEVPVYMTVIDGNKKIVTSDKVLKTKFIRKRYPNRFKKEAAVISAERACPSCGGAFQPDENGNCTFCGCFLFADQLKWRRV